MGVLSNKQQVEALVARQNEMLKKAASKPKGMSFNDELDAISCAMAANLIMTEGKADGFSNKVVVK